MQKCLLKVNMLSIKKDKRRNLEKSPQSQEMVESIKAICSIIRPQGQMVSVSSSTKCSPHN